MLTFVSRTFCSVGGIFSLKLVLIEFTISNLNMFCICTSELSLKPALKTAVSWIYGVCRIFKEVIYYQKNLGLKVGIKFFLGYKAF